MKLSNIAQIPAFYAKFPTALPLGGGRTMAGAEGNPNAGQFNSYSRVNCENLDGTLIMAQRSDGTFSVLKADTGEFLGTIPGSSQNPVHSGLNPRWARDGKPLEIVWCGHDWNKVMRQTWDKPTTQAEVCTAPSGHIFFNNGGEGDLSDDGRFMPVKLSTGYSGGFYQGVKCGVVDIVNKKLLPGLVPGNPNGLDVSPCGTWLAYTDHEGKAVNGPNKFFRIADLAAGTVAPLHIDSAITSGVQSVGHAGWAKSATGATVFVYQDNRDDMFKYFDPALGKSTAILTFLEMFGQWKGGQHIGRHGDPGWFCLSTYDCTPLPDGSWHPWANAIVMVELATKKGVIVTPTKTKFAGYFSEAYACISKDGRRVYWGGNDNGADNLELNVAAVPVPTGGQVPPTGPVDPTPTPAPTTFSWPAFVDGKQVTVTMTFK
jgi:hypothetical protein